MRTIYQARVHINPRQTHTRFQGSIGKQDFGRRIEFFFQVNQQNDEKNAATEHVKVAIMNALARQLVVQRHRQQKQDVAQERKRKPAQREITGDKQAMMSKRALLDGDSKSN
jgi:hypothetical protein